MSGLCHVSILIRKFSFIYSFCREKRNNREWRGNSQCTRVKKHQTQLTQVSLPLSHTRQQEHSRSMVSDDPCCRNRSNFFLNFQLKVSPLLASKYNLFQRTCKSLSAKRNKILTVITAKSDERKQRGKRREKENCS